MDRHDLEDIRLLSSIGACLTYACMLLLPQGGSLDAQEPPTIRDSAGVTIIENAESVRAAPILVSGVPEVRVGAREGDLPELFTEIRDATRLPDGRLVVVDGGSREIRLFGPEGGHIETMGGRGNGPGEFGNAPFIAFAPPDTIVAWDQRNRRITRFNTGGDVLSTSSMLDILEREGIPLISGGIAWDLRSDGTLLSTSGALSLNLSPGLQDWSVRPVLFHPGGQAATVLGPFPLGQQMRVRRPDGRGNFGVRNPFAVSTPMTLGPDPFPFLAAPGYGWEIRYFDRPGNLARIVRLRLSRIALTQGIVDASRDSLAVRAQESGISPDVVEGAFGDLSILDSLPAIADVKTTTTGEVWIERNRSPVEPTGEVTYEVLDAEGRWMWTVVLPEALGTVLEVGQDYLLTTSEDEVGAPRLEVYRFQPGGSRF